MAWFVECPFCHKSVFRWFYSWHESKHTARRADGQMNEHITAAPDLRFDGSLDGVPQGYRHAKCGVTTGMPEEIIRTYLVQPLTYNDSSFCCGCSDYVISSELIWIETGESVMSYMCKLRADYLRSELGIDPSGSEIILTPSTLAKIRSISAKGFKPLLALEMFKRDSDINYKLDVVADWNRRNEALIDLGDAGVVVRKDQRRQLGGTIIHYNEAAQGFTIARFVPWQ
jgi:hypothetical protein